MKKLSLEELNEFHTRVVDNLKSNRLRAGQTMFNCLYETYSELADAIRATNADCFHSNSRIPLFLQEISENKEELENSNWKTILQQIKQ